VLVGTVVVDVFEQLDRRHECLIGRLVPHTVLRDVDLHAVDFDGCGLGHRDGALPGFLGRFELLHGVDDVVHARDVIQQVEQFRDQFLFVFEEVFVAGDFELVAAVLFFQVDRLAGVDLHAVLTFELDRAAASVEDPVAGCRGERALVGFDDLAGRQRPDAEHAHRVVGGDAVVVAFDVTDVVVGAVDGDEARRARGAGGVVAEFLPLGEATGRRDGAHVLGVVDFAVDQQEEALEVVRGLAHLVAELAHCEFGRAGLDDDRHLEAALFEAVLVFDDGEELVGLLPVVDVADFRDDEAVDVLDGAVCGVGNLEHVLEALVARLGAVTMPDDAGVDLAGELVAFLGDDFGDVLGALVAHVRRGGVLVVRHPDVRGLHATESDGATEFLRGVVDALLGGRRRKERAHELPAVRSLVEFSHESLGGKPSSLLSVFKLFRKYKRFIRFSAKLDIIEGQSK